MNKLTILLTLLLVVSACGKDHSGSSRTTATTPKVEVENSVITEQEQFVQEIQEEYDLSESSVELVKEELQNDVEEEKKDPYTKSRKMFCVSVGAASIIDMAQFSCRSFKGDRIDLSFIGLGYSFGVHSGVSILYAKKGSRHLKEGTYNVGLSALHFGLGLMGLKISNDNGSINWRMKGVTLGLGVNMSMARMTIRKVPKRFPEA